MVTGMVVMVMFVCDVSVLIGTMMVLFACVCFRMCLCFGW